MNWFFNQWYFGSGHPKINVSTTYDPVKKQTNISIAQTQTEFFEFPLTVDVFEAGKPKRHTFWVEAKSKNDFSVNTNAKADFVNVNPDGVLLAQINNSLTLENYLSIYQNSKDFRSRYRAVENAVESTEKK